MKTFVLAMSAAILLLLQVQTANAATISIVSMRYSAAHPVPHLHYEGETLDGDIATLRDMYDAFVKCRLACIGPDGGNTAVLTLNGPGGSYYEGLAMADFLRENHIATVVERDMQCYSACAFAFLGGSGYSTQEGVGTYIDRMVEPGSVVGFHAPYANEDSFMQALADRGAMAAQGDTRDSLATMVKELVKWNVDPEVLFYMVGMGPDDTYKLLAADDLYLARVALPPTPPMSWITDLPEAIRNVCTRLLAIYERADPLEMEDRFLSGWTPQIGRAEYFGDISGYKLSDRILDIGNCAVTDRSLATDGAFEVSLYFSPGIDGFNYPGTSFNNSLTHWSNAGNGGDPVKRIFQRGPMNHYLLPMGVNIDALDLPGEAEIDRNRYNLPLSPLLPTLPDDLVVASSSPSSRISSIGDVFVFERVGPPLLFERTLGQVDLGRTYSETIIGESGFLREGTFDDTGATFSSFGFVSGEASTVVDLLLVKPEGVPPTDEDLATLKRLQCAIEWEGLSLGCS